MSLEKKDRLLNKKMPYCIRQVSPNRYSVINKETGKVHAYKTTLQKAQAQLRILNDLEHGRIIKGGSTIYERGLAALLRDKYNLSYDKPQDLYKNTGVPIRTIFNSIIHEKSPSLVKRIYYGKPGYIDLNKIAINRFDHKDLTDLRNYLDKYGQIGSDWKRWEQMGLHKLP